MGVKTWHRSLCALSLALGLVASVGLPGLAQSSNGGAGEFPGRRVGGGTRGDCVLGNQALVALSPANNLSVTAQEQPTLHFAVPTAATPYTGRFLLHDSDENRIYDTNLSLGAEAVVGVQLPPGLLQIGQDYHWSFVVSCQPDAGFQPVVLEGWLRRVTPVTTTPVAPEERLHLATTYQTAGLWSDAISLLVELRQDRPQDQSIETQWHQLLSALELEDVVP